LLRIFAFFQSLLKIFAQLFLPEFKIGAGPGEPRTRQSQKSDGVSPTNTSNLLLNPVTKKIRP
jgi:hypothetical protein